MKRQVIQLLAVGLGLVGVSVASPASSAVILASAGQSRLGGERACFTFNYGRASNGCQGGVRMLDVTPPSPTGATRTFTATGRSDYGNTTCAASVTDQTGWNVWYSGQKALVGNILTPSTPKTLGTYSVGSTDGLVFECNVESTGTSTDYVGSFTY